MDLGRRTGCVGEPPLAPAASSRRLSGDDPEGPMSERHASAGGATWRAALAALVAGALVRLFFAARMPLFPDETYYWEWSRHLAAGYFDHPPAIPLLIRGGTELFGATSFGVRFFPVLAGFIASLAVS